MAISKYTIKITDILGEDGKQCNNPSFTWDHDSCIGFKCEEDKNKKEVKITIPDDCLDKCVYVNYRCDDTCTDCEPIRKKLCPCDTNADCLDCESCGPDGYCISDCADDEFCDLNGNCVECDPEHPCENGGQCVAGKCECPPSKPYKNSKGDCVPCLEGTCPPGEICTPEGCKPIDCEEGVYSVEKGKCVQCINAGDCKKAHEVCKDNGCVCESGYVRDPISKECVPEPECTEEEDCGVCGICVDNGCVPRECGDGKVCIEEAGGCVEKCDCDNPSCSKSGDGCAKSKSGVCYCSPCEGSCLDGDGCEDHCFCNGNKQCAPKSCAGSCTDGTDCGDNCGCLDNKCVDCASVDCDADPEACARILGCGCEGKSCVKQDDCEKMECSNTLDCGDDCTCDEAICQDCANYSCDTCSSHPGCICSNGTCEGDPNYKCKDKHEAKINEDCTLEAKLTLQEGCACPVLTVNTKIVTASNGALGTPPPPPGTSPIPWSLVVDMELRKGMASTYSQAIGNPLLSNTNDPNIADNDRPISGTYKVVKDVFVQRYKMVGGQKIKDGDIIKDSSRGSMQIITTANEAIATFSGTYMSFFKYGSFVDMENLVQIIETVYTFYKESDFIFPNQCNYRHSIKIGGFTIDRNNSNEFAGITGGGTISMSYESFKQLTSSDKRAPRHKFYKSKDKVYNEQDVIRDIYIPVVSGVSSDKLMGPAKIDPKGEVKLTGKKGELWGNRYYAHSVDCGCDTKMVDMGLALFCNPKDFQYEMKNCNTVIMFKGTFEPCSVNQDIDQWTQAGYTVDADVRTKYELWLNGTKVTTFVHKKNVGMVVEGSSASMFAVTGYRISTTDLIPITSAEIRINYDGQGKCTIKKAIPPAVVPKIEPVKTCGANGKVTLSFPAAGIDEITSDAPNVGIVKITGHFLVTGNSKQEIPVKIKLTAGCVIESTYSYDCCASLNITNKTAGMVNTTGGSVIVPLKVGVSGGRAPYTVEYSTKSGGLIGVSTDGSTDYKVNTLVLKGENASVTAVVKDANGCEKFIDFVINSVVSDNPNPNPGSGDYLFSAILYQNQCSYTGSVKIDIPNDNSLIGKKLKYSLNGGIPALYTIQSVNIGSPLYIPVSPGQKFKLIDFNVDASLVDPTELTMPLNLNDGKPKVNSLMVNGSTLPFSVCAGADVPLTLKGSPDAIVTFNSGLASLTLDGAGDGVLTVNPITNINYIITKIQSNDGTCSGTEGLNKSLQINVTPSPTIEVVSTVCNNQLTAKTITFNSITSAKDQLGNSLTVVGNAVTVDPNTVTSIIATKVSGSCTVSLEVPVGSCTCPDISIEITGTTPICAGDSVTLTAVATGGVAPFTYQWYVDGTEDGQQTLINTRQYVPSVSTTYGVQVTDANNCPAAYTTKVISVSEITPANIVPNPGQMGVEEDTSNHFNLCDDETTAIFKTEVGYSSYLWTVTGAYLGVPTSSTDPTFPITVAQVTGAAFVKVQVTSASGCVSEEQVQLTKISCNIIEDDEVLFTVDSSKLYKVALSASAITSIPTLLKSGLPGGNIALRSTNELIVGNGTNLYKYNITGGYIVQTIPSINNGFGLSLITDDIAILGGSSNPDGDKIFQYIFSTGIRSTAYTLTDPTYSYNYSTDSVKVGSTLYIMMGKYPKNNYASSLGTAVLACTLSGSTITGFTDLGFLPTNPGEIPIGIASLPSGIYVLYSYGAVYKLDTSNPSASVQIGTVNLYCSDMTNK